ERQHLVAEPRLDGMDRDAVLLEARAPPRQAARRDLEANLDGKSVPHARRRELLPREERQIRPRMPFGIRIEEVVRAGIVLVDAALDQSHAQDARVEV